jgi:hypothetical protein
MKTVLQNNTHPKQEVSMRKSIGVVVACAMVIGMVGCGGGQAVRQQKIELQKELKLPAAWINPPVENPKAREGYLFGTGSYGVRIDDPDPGFAKTMADERARVEIQKTLQNTVASSVKDHYARAGHTRSSAEEAAKAASVSIGAFDVSGSEVYRREFKEGILYSFARFPLDPQRREELLGLLREGIVNREAQSNEQSAEKEWEMLQNSVMESIKKKIGGR